MKVMLLAAGKGERMLPLTRQTPKPLLEAGGKALIVHHIENLAAQGFTDLVINHAWLGEQLERTLGDGGTWGVNIAWSRESEPLETAGAIIQARDLLGESPFICINTDIWTDYSFTGLPDIGTGDDLAWLVMVDNPPQHPAGDFVVSNRRVREPRTGEAALTWSGIAVYHPRLVDGLAPGKRSVVPLLRQAMAAGRVGGEYYSGRWFDIGTPERLAGLDRMLRA